MIKKTIERNKKLLQMELNLRKEKNKLLPKIIEVLKDYDKKMYSIRLDKKLKKIDNRIYTNYEKEYVNSSFTIDFKEYRNRSFTVGERAFYIKNNSFNIAFLPAEKAMYDEESKRINSKEIIRDLKEKAEKEAEKIKKIEKELTEVEEIITKKENLENELIELRDGLDYNIRNYFWEKNNWL